MHTLLKNKRTEKKKEPGFLSNLLEMDFSLKSREISGKIMEVYVIFILAVYPLFLFQESWMGITVKTLLYYAVTISTLFAAILLALEQKFEFRKPKEELDYIVLGIGGINLMMILFKIADGSGDYGKNILWMGLAITFYMLASEFVWYRYYTDLFLISGTIAILWLLIRYMLQPDFAVAGLLLQNGPARSAYMLLIALAAGAEYMESREKENDFFYLVISGAAYVILFLGQSRSFLLLGLCCMTAMPLFFRETAEKVKRGVILIFLYLFLYSNMALLASYGGLLKTKTSFSLMNSVYLDLAIAAALVLFFHYWDKLPEKTVLEELLLPKSRTVFLSGLTLESIFAVVAVLGAERLHGMEGSGLEKSLCDFAVGFSAELRSGQNAFLDMMADSGVIGTGLLILLVAALCMREKRHAEGAAPIFTQMTGILFLILLFLMPIDEVMAPIFVVFGAYAIYGKKESQKRM